MNNDAVFHVFGDCAYSIDLWLLNMNHLKIVHNWKKAHVADNLKASHMRKVGYDYLPFFVLWEV